MGARVVDPAGAEGLVVVEAAAAWAGEVRPVLLAGGAAEAGGVLPSAIRAAASGDGWRSEVWALCAAVLAARGRPGGDGVFVHPTAVVEGAVELGAGTRVWHFSKLLGPLSIGARCSLGQNVVVERGVVIGDDVKVQNNVSIYSGVILEDGVFCGPSMVFTNVAIPRSRVPRKGAYQTTRVGRGASIGANATVVCGHSLGAFCFVGAGAVVTRDVPAFALVYGNPARQHGWACYCGERLPLLVNDEDEMARCAACGRAYARRGSVVEMLTPEEGE
ncbi:MAG: N-acetyltransferase [Myxococcales bacterium]|nr:N-acetyltransferase [Myxococcales bacterium]